MSAGPTSKGLRWYGYLLKLYPKAYRQRYGPQLQDTVSDMLDNAVPSDRARLWRRIASDYVLSLIKEHYNNFGERMDAPVKHLSQRTIWSYKTALGLAILTIGVYLWHALGLRIFMWFHVDFKYLTTFLPPYSLQLLVYLLAPALALIFSGTGLYNQLRLDKKDSLGSKNGLTIQRYRPLLLVLAVSLMLFGWTLYGITQMHFIPTNLGL